MQLLIALIVNVYLFWFAEMGFILTLSLLISCAGAFMYHRIMVAKDAEERKPQNVFNLLFMFWGLTGLLIGVPSLLKFL